jgi:hypothetical protein
MHLLDELEAARFDIYNVIPKGHCQVFEGNVGAIEMARLPKMRPRTKYLQMKYHHFRTNNFNLLIVLPKQ